MGACQSGARVYGGVDKTFDFFPSFAEIIKILFEDINSSSSLPLIATLHL